MDIKGNGPVIRVSFLSKKLQKHKKSSEIGMFLEETFEYIARMNQFYYPRPIKNCHSQSRIIQYHLEFEVEINVQPRSG